VPLSLDPNDDSHLGCSRVKFPHAWHRSEQRGFWGWTRDPVPDRDGAPVFPFASAFDLPADVDPMDSLLRNLARLHESRMLFGDGRDYPLSNSDGGRGYSNDPDQRREHLNYVLVAACGNGRSQMIVFDTTRDTEAQLDRELLGVVTSLRLPESLGQR